MSQVVRGARLCVGVRALFEGTLLAVGSLIGDTLVFAPFLLQSRLKIAFDSY